MSSATSEPLRFDTTAADATPLGVVDDRDGRRSPGSACRSSAAIGCSGVLALESLEPHAFDEADERLLGTLASSMGVALENARLFDETKRLLDRDGRAGRRARGHQRDRRGARAQLEFEAIIELVGERVRGRSSRVRSIFIALYDAATNLISWPVRHRRGRARSIAEPWPLGQGLTSTVIRTSRPLRVGTADEQEAAGAIQIGGTDTQSWLGVPILAANRVIGVLGLESLEAARLQRGRRAAPRAPSRRAWASRSRTPACSTRRSAC